MAVKYKLDEDARDKFDRRAVSGVEALKTHDTYTSEERETCARDLVSDILTALFGPAGYCTNAGQPGGHFDIVLDEERGGRARTFLDMAYESWEGDAEDYIATLVDNPLLPEEKPKGEPTVADIKAKIIAEIDGFDAPEDEREREAWIENLDSETYGRYQAYLDVLALVNYDIRET